MRVAEGGRPPAGHDPACPARGVDELQNEAEGIMQEHLLHPLKHAPRAFAPDLVGWRYEFAQYLLSDQSCCEAFTLHAHLAARGLRSPLTYDVPRIDRVTPSPQKGRLLAPPHCLPLYTPPRLDEFNMHTAYYEAHLRRRRGTLRAYRRGGLPSAGA